LSHPLFLRACAGEPTERAPIWLMRQAGRYLPEYKKLREGRTMLQTVSTPELAVEATLQPIRRLGFDAAILFSDLTVAFTPLGAPFEIKEGVGPVVDQPVRTRADVSRLHLFEPHDGLSYVMEAIRLLKRELAVPLIGFTGAPFTLASYLIEGGPSRDLKRTKAMLYGEPQLWSQLMELLAETVLRFLRAQIDAGADAVQLFDSWIGQLDAATYRESVLPYVKSIFDGLRELGAPTIYFGTGNAALLEVMAEAGSSVFGVDWRTSLSEAGRRVPGRPLQGNLDPTVLLSSPEVVERKALEVLTQAKGLPGHVFNLGHGIFPETPLENVERLVSVVKSTPRLN
jgi:uroporphyrinogen decarboxylase